MFSKIIVEKTTFRKGGRYSRLAEGNTMTIYFRKLGERVVKDTSVAMATVRQWGVVLSREYVGEARQVSH